MRTQKEIRQIYRQQIELAIAGIRKTRWLIIAATTCIFLSIFLFISAIAFEGWVPWVLVIVAVILFFLAKTAREGLYERLEQEFKEDVVCEVVRAINPEFQFLTNDRVEPDLYRAAKLFPSTYDLYLGDYLVLGQIGRIPFAFSDLYTELKGATTYRGLFFTSNFGRIQDGDTLVVPKDYFSTLQSRYAMQQSELKPIKMDSPQFDSAFSVYGTSPEAAQSAFTPAITEAILDIHTRFGRPLRLSLIGSNVYCAIPTEKMLFQPNIRGLKFRDVEEMFALFNLLEFIITQLDQNTALWTEE
ncbi:MAG: hypothetical protein CSA97_01515 [Bacteroidetes bacterium]|nr:MAG: hypothetical protein CSA97_01515 [Bacteroidota bacterium]